MYQHFSAAELEFILQGELTGDGVQELQHAWVTASSVQAGKKFIVDVSGITNADAGGFELLSRMRVSGARLIAALPAASEDFLRSLGVPAPAPRQSGRSPWSLRVLRRAGLCSS